MVKWLSKKGVEKKSQSISNSFKSNYKYLHCPTMVGLKAESHAKKWQIERCGNAINNLKKCFVDHAKYSGLDNVVMRARKPLLLYVTLYFLLLPIQVTQLYT